MDKNLIKLAYEAGYQHGFNSVKLAAEGDDGKNSRLKNVANKTVETGKKLYDVARQRGEESLRKHVSPETFEKLKGYKNTAKDYAARGANFVKNHKNTSIAVGSAMTALALANAVSRYRAKKRAKKPARRYR